ncbi:hypothetical protein [Spongiactinospora sp. TRM90649]|uniref:hypothetical protein n=1 Tax=Spongiactinospora sp. TRM90649 TaxID=3031114 RepID=UPI0023F7E570|nr:hypothetical protein [Spongiactinospora sp. TRM90649]MDF5757781.1 hypothetical protein [Spongiactinospora sp. TRM90649]
MKVIQSEAELSRDHFSPAQSVWDKATDRIDAESRRFIEHCSRAFVRSKLWDPSSWPDKDCLKAGQPIPDLPSTASKLKGLGRTPRGR